MITINRPIPSVFLFVMMIAWVCTSYAQKSDQSARKIIPMISSSKHTEFAPTISADGRTLIFESNIDKTWKLFESNLDSKGNWSKPVPLTTINEKLNFLAGPSLTYDGNVLYFTGFIENVSSSEDIFYSERRDGNNWSEPKNIGAPINTSGYEGFPSISADGNSLYFIRLNEENPYDRKSKEACFKIFVSNKKADGTWGEPEALPSSVNKGCERDPRIMADNHTLILSSVREEGKGKYDLYQTQKLADGTWTEPMALDFVNSEENDQSPCISAAGDIIFFYSKNDIYAIPIPEKYRQMINVTVQGYVRDEKTNKPVAAKINVMNLTTGKSFTSQSNANDGRYSVVLSAGQQYTVEFSSAFNVSSVSEFDLRQQDRYVELDKDIHLKDEYKVKLTIQDKDLNKPIASWFSVVDDKGVSVMKDSLDREQYPFAITLQAGKNYNFSVAAPGYPASDVQWNFDPEKMKPEMSYAFSLEHIKVPFSAEVIDIVSNKKVKSKVYFNNQNTDEIIIADPGETVQLRKGERYQVVTSSDKGYVFSSTEIVAGGNGAQNENQVTLKMTPIEAGVHLTLDHITFATNSAELESASSVTLERVVELLQTNRNVSIEISAHTDDVGDATYNHRLSERRALCIVRYLSKKGIPIQRMRPIGYGKEKPLVANDSEEHRAMNRRVELRILRVEKEVLASVSKN